MRASRSSRKRRSLIFHLARFSTSLNRLRKFSSGSRPPQSGSVADSLRTLRIFIDPPVQTSVRPCCGVTSRSGRQRPLHPLGRERHTTNAHAARTKARVADLGYHRTDRRLAGTGGCKLRMVDQHDVDRFRRFGDVEDRIGHPVHAGHVLGVELDLLPQRAADTLNDVAFDCMRQTIRIYDLATVVGDREFARPDFAGLPVDFDLRYHSDARAVALSISDAPTAGSSAGLVAARRRTRLPPGFLSRCSNDCNVARVFDVSQAERHRVDAERRGELIHERFTGKVDLRTDRIAQMRTAQRRSAIEQRRDRLPRHSFVGEFIGLGRHAETVVRFQRQAHELASQAILGPTLISLDIPAGKTFTREFIGYDVARGINRGAGAVNRGRTFRIPRSALFASVLHANGAADCTGEDGGIYRYVPRIAASIRARTGRPDGPYLFGRKA